MQFPIGVTQTALSALAKELICGNEVVRENFDLLRTISDC